MTNLTHLAKPAAALLFCIITVFPSTEGPLAAKPERLITGVVDSTGKPVGKLVGTFRRGSGGSGVPLIYADVSMQVNGRLFIIAVDKHRFYGNAEVYFTGSNCTGQAYFEQHIVDAAPRMVPLVGTNPNTYEVYVPNENVGVTAVLALSRSLFNGDLMSTRCDSFGGTLTDALEAINIGDLSTLYVPPFTMQVAP